MSELSQKLVKLATFNWSLKLLSLAFAVGLWFYVYYQMPDSEEPEEVALVLKNLPPNLIRTSDIISKADVVLQGSSAKLRRLAGAHLYYEIDLANAGPGKLSYRIIDTRIKGASLSGLEVVQMVPTEVTITLSERVEKSLPVEIVTRGEPAKGYAVEDKSADPPLVKVSGAKEEMGSLKAVATEVVDIAGRKDSYLGEHALDLHGRHIDMLDAQQVKVQIQIVPDLVQREFSAIPVVVQNTALPWTVKPPTLDLRLKGSAELMRKMKQESVRLTIDASGLAAGEYRLKPQLALPAEGRENDVVPVGLDLPEVKVILAGDSSKIKDPVKQKKQ